MKTGNIAQTRNTCRVLSFAWATALPGAASLPVRAGMVAPPAVPPANIEVPAGNRAFLATSATGTQDYVRLPSGPGFAWTFFGLRATRFDRAHRQVVTHFLSPNPFENDTPRVTWQHSVDTSAVRGKLAESSSDPAFVNPDAIPRLLVQGVGAKDGPTGGNEIYRTTFIQRLNTGGGVAPSTGCAEPADVGKKALVPYEADYILLRPCRRSVLNRRSRNSRTGQVIRESRGGSVSPFTVAGYRFLGTGCSRLHPLGWRLNVPLVLPEE